MPSRAYVYVELLSAHGPLTDHEAAEILGKPLSVVNAIRGDIKAWAEHHGRACPVVAVDRVRKEWGSGQPTTRVRWGWEAGTKWNNAEGDQS
jgi:hypothetical protein